MRKTLVALFTCAFAFGATALLPADVSPIASAYAKGGGGAVAVTAVVAAMAMVADMVVAWAAVWAVARVATLATAWAKAMTMPARPATMA